MDHYYDEEAGSILVHDQYNLLCRQCRQTNTLISYMSSADSRAAYEH